MQRTDITFHDLPYEILAKIFSQLHPVLLLQLSSYVEKWFYAFMRGKESESLWLTKISDDFSDQVQLIQKQQVNWLPTHATFFGMFHTKYKSFDKVERMALSAITGRDEICLKLAVEAMKKQKKSIMGFCFKDKENQSVLSMIQAWDNQAILDWIYQADFLDNSGFCWQVSQFIWAIACRQPSEPFRETVNNTSLCNLTEDAQYFRRSPYNVMAFAVLQNRLDWVKLLQERILENDSSAYSWHYVDSNQETILTIAAKAGHVSIVEYFINSLVYSYGSIKNSWFAAAKAGNKNVLQSFLTRFPTIIDEFGQLTLLLAAEHNNDEVVEYLVEKNASVETQPSHTSALSWAIVLNNENIVRRLIQAGVKVSAVERSFASSHNMLDVINTHRLSRPQ